MEYSLVGFLDVLGFSAMVKKDSESSLPIYLPMFTRVFEELKNNERQDVSVRMFSDSIILEASLSPESLANVVEVTAELQRKFLQSNILIRGGISFGKHHSDENLIFSQALISAYTIESRVARFPRVVVDDDLINYSWHHSDIQPEGRDRLRTSLMKDRDGAIFVNYLTANNLAHQRSPVELCLSKSTAPTETVLEKMRWLLDYYNHQAQISGMPTIEGVPFSNGFRDFAGVS